MDKLAIIEHQGQRVLTTAQLAEMYETDSQIITNNFNRNKERYQSGGHYFRLIGQEVDSFCQHQIDLTPASTQILYLWTERGCLHHAKSLGTDKAWQVYEQLVDCYFKVKESRDLSPVEALLQSVTLLAEQERRLSEVEQTLRDTHQQTHYLEAQLKDTQRGLVDINEPLRHQFNDEIRAYAKRHKIDFPVAYNNVYDILDAQEHIDIRLRAQHKGVKPVEIVESLHLLARAIQIAKVL
ncbi:MAG: ORF6N domain-containing protein [bacterium]